MKVPETEDESASPEFNEFSKLLTDGQRIADETKKSHFFTWRGYKGCISSQIPRLNFREIKRQFDLAMESLKQQERSSQSSTASAQSSSSSCRVSSESIQSQEEITQVPETQCGQEG